MRKVKVRYNGSLGSGVSVRIGSTEYMWAGHGDKYDPAEPWRVIEMPEDHAKHLVKTNPNFEVVKKGGEKNAVQ